jgi:hypothetical protein
MNMRNEHPTSIGCVTLAVFATGISLCLSVLTGFQLVDTLLAKIIMAAFGLLAVLGAHLMLAISASSSPGRRVVGLTLWLFCMAYVAFSHVNFFLSSQQETGMMREKSIVFSPIAKKPQKELIEVLNDKVKVQTELAQIQLRCRETCLRLAPAKANLEGRLAVLDAQEFAARSWQKTVTQQQKRQDIAQNNPVLGRLAEWSNVTITNLELLLGMIFSLVLEGVACFCWYLVLGHRDPYLTHSVTAPVVVTEGVPDASHIGQMTSAQQYDDQIDELVQLVRSGHIRLTVASIRQYFRCAQGKAADLKRLVQARIDKESYA